MGKGFFQDAVYNSKYFRLSWHNQAHWLNLQSIPWIYLLLTIYRVTLYQHHSPTTRFKFPGHLLHLFLSIQNILHEQKPDSSFKNKSFQNHQYIPVLLEYNKTSRHSLLRPHIIWLPHHITSCYCSHPLLHVALMVSSVSQASWALPCFWAFALDFLFQEVLFFQVRQV